MYCKICGTEIPDGKSACPKCGTLVKQMPRQETPAVRAAYMKNAGNDPSVGASSDSRNMEKNQMPWRYEKSKVERLF
ncbi:MAG: zinc ribbon domain-containing protein [Ruminococcus sp.]|nr:zinc ribbon domain-containing protein [Ruminococcus sp.]